MVSLFRILSIHLRKSANILKPKLPTVNIILFYTTLLLVRLPPIYLTPIRSAFLTSHSIARYLIVASTILSAGIIASSVNKKTIPGPQAIFVLLYFFSQSLTITKAFYIDDFWLEYKNIIFSMLIFFITYSITEKRDFTIIIYIFLFTGMVNLIFEYFSYINPESIESHLKPIFYDNYWESWKYQLGRRRFFPEIFDEILIPFLFYSIYREKNVLSKTSSIIYILAISIFSLLSNWRIRLVMMIFSLFASLVTYFKKSVRLSMAILELFIFLFTISYVTSTLIIGTNSLHRLVSPSKEDILNITQRIKFFSESAYVSSVSPVFGIGLGQYEEYVPIISRIPFLFTSNISIRNIQVAYYPHNVFFNTLATSGIFGLVAFTVLILYFLKSDLTCFWKKTFLEKSYIIAFWTMFFLSNTTPTNFFSYLMIFWLVRAIIEKLKTEEKHENSSN